MKHIVIAQPLAISSALLDTLTTDLQKDGFTITAYDSLPKDQDELGDRLADADLAVIANYPLRKEALAKAASLKYLCVAFTGVDHVAIDYCKEKGIAVSNCAGYSTESVAELTFSLILALYRKLSEGGCAARNGKTSAGLMGIEIGHRKFGIIGTGAIGRRVADIASAFGADVYGCSRSRKAASITYTDLDTLLSTCDIISVHLPLTSETRGVIDNAALADFLREGKIAGAGIDVFDGEPPLAKDDPLLSAPNTVLTPHVGFFTEEAMARRAVIVMDNLRAYLKGKQENVIC